MWEAATLPPIEHYVSTSVEEFVYIFGGLIKEGSLRLPNSSLFRVGVGQIAKLTCEPNLAWPESRTGDTLTAIGQNHLVLFGGFSSGKLLNDLWLFDIRSSLWTIVRQQSPWPRPRSGHCSAYDSSNNELYVFGGLEAEDSGIFWKFNFDQHHWSMLSHGDMSNTIGGSAAEYCGNIVILGGADSNNTFRPKQVYIYHIKTSTWDSMALPNAMKRRKCANSFRVANYWFISGGLGVNGHCSCMWMIDLRSRRAENFKVLSQSYDFNRSLVQPILVKKNQFIACIFRTDSLRTHAEIEFEHIVLSLNSVSYSGLSPVLVINDPQVSQLLRELRSQLTRLNLSESQLRHRMVALCSERGLSIPIPTSDGNEMLAMLTMIEELIIQLQAEKTMTIKDTPPDGIRVCSQPTDKPFKRIEDICLSVRREILVGNGNLLYSKKQKKSS